MKAKAKEFASVRLTADLRKQIGKLATEERRSISLMIRILIEEALGLRYQEQANIPAFLKVQSKLTSVDN